MPILQDKLVIKSIEALHDEALALMPDNANNRDISKPPNVLHATTPLQELPINAPETTVTNASLGSEVEHNIMSRIDNLLKKLDEDDDVEIAPLAEEGRQSNPRNATNNFRDAATPEKMTKNSPASPDSPPFADTEDHADESTILNSDAHEVAKEAANKPFNETGNNTNNNAGDDMFSNNQPGEATPPNQTQALADIAEAIYQARRQAVDSDVADARQDNAPSLNMNALSAAIADEVRRTISEVIMAELPQMVRDAVGETIRALPTLENNHSKSTNKNSLTAKGVTPRKTATISKAVKAGTKKASAKKSTTKEAINKTTPDKKLSKKKGKVKKVTVKKTATSV